VYTRRMRAYDAIVLGLGGMGSATAYQLARRGARVLGIEQFTPAHDRGSSHGRTRIYRQAYGEGEQYVPLLLRAFEMWRELERDSGRELLQLTGGLFIGRDSDRTVAGATASARAHGLKHELLDAAETRRRFPQFALNADEIALYEENAGALFPEDAVRAQLDLATRAGAELRFGTPVERWQADDDGVRIVVRGETIAGNRLIVTAGAWAGRMLAELGLPLQPERNVQCWWRPLARPELFAAGRMPIFIWERDGRPIYGLPDLRGAGVKAAIHHTGETVDPDAQRRPVDNAEIDAVRAALDERLPDLAGDLVDASTCMYTNTPDEHFVVGLHPALSRVAIAAGFSGHGFKFAPVIGETLAALCLDGASRWPIGSFRPDRFAAQV
jgi:sarcosine oxidase